MALVDPRKPRLEIAESEGFMSQKLPSLSPESNRQRKRAPQRVFDWASLSLSEVIEPVPWGNLSCALCD